MRGIKGSTYNLKRLSRDVSKKKLSLLLPSKGSNLATTVIRPDFIRESTGGRKLI